ncbi:hypothetical protein NU688_10095 [Variovorax sp. ZS18.2.2]|nr:hypothetical protein [Variovorax sp. ZS18.2.2]
MTGLEEEAFVGQSECKAIEKHEIQTRLRPQPRCTRMIKKIPYPFSLDVMKRNLLFLPFCPPDGLDSDGRPVLEGRSIYYKPGEKSYRRCTYGDSRSHSGKPMNLESLQALNGHKSDVQELIHDLSDILRTKLPEADGLSWLKSLYALAYILYKAPSYFFVRQVLDSSVKIPGFYASASRFSHGLVNMLSILALDHDGQLGDLHCNAEELYGIADRSGYLVGRNEVCAAPKNQIIAYFELMRVGLAGEIDRSGGNKRPQKQDIQAVCDFGCAMFLLEIISLVYETVRCRLWRCGHVASSDAASAANEPRALHAITHCSVAQRISRDRQPFSHVLFRRLSNFYWGESDGRYSIHQIVASANELLEKSELARVDPTAWEFQLAGFQERVRNSLLAHRPVLPECTDEGALLSSGLDIFFGKWPQ